MAYILKTMVMAIAIKILSDKLLINDVANNI